MAHIEVVPPEKAEGRLAEVYDEIKQARGDIANLLRVQSLLPETLQAHLDLYVSIQFGQHADGLGRRERELLAVVVSATNRCDYCVAHHTDALSRYVPDEDLVARVRDDWRRARLPPREAILCEFAEQLTRNPSTVRKDHVDALRKAGFSDTAILQCVLTTAYFNFANRLALGLGVEADDVRMAYTY